MADPRPLHVKIPVRDELTGEVVLHFVLTNEDIEKIRSWKPGVAKLYLGGVGRQLQRALRDVDLSLL